MFPENFFQEILPTTDDLGFDDYLTTLREEWFVVFDRMAKLLYVTAPKRLNPDNQVDPMYVDILTKNTWPDYKRREVRSQYTKAQLRAEVERMARQRHQYVASHSVPSSQTSMQSHAVLPLVSQTPDTAKQRVTIKLDNPMEEPHDIINDRVEFSAGTFEVTIEPSIMDETANEPPKTKVVSWTRKVLGNPANIQPVPLSVKTKKRKGKDRELLEKLDLHRVKIDEDDTNAEAEVDDPEHPNYATAKKRKFSTQTTKSIRDFQMKHSGLMELDNEDYQMVDDDNYKKELDAFIEDCFVKWGWFSEKEYKKDLFDWVVKMNAKDISAEEKTCLKRLITAIKDERAYYTAQFTNEFRFTRQTMVRALRFAKENNSFYARLVYTERDKNDPETLVEKEEEMRVEEEWVRAEYEEDDIQHVINMNQSNKWVDVPKDVEVRIAKTKVVRVRYVPEHDRYVLDYKAMAKKIRKKDIKNAKRRDLLGFEPLPVPDMQTELDASLKRRVERANVKGFPTKVARRPLVTVLDPKELEAQQKLKEDEIWRKSIIRKAVPIAAKWSGKLTNGKETTLEEEFVVMAFGEAFAFELKSNKSGWVDIPVGDYKPSHLHEHPNLKVIGAPRVHFNQSDGKDLCVSKALASALYATGFHEEANQIDAFGEEIIKGAISGALDKVAKHARTVLPSWIVIRSLPKDFDWTQSLDERHMLLGVLLASDGSCCHAIAIHGGFIYDANEKIGLPLCQEALNYCTSTSLVKSKFVGFRRGYVLRYEGTKKQRLAKMTLEAKEIFC